MSEQILNQIKNIENVFDRSLKNPHINTTIVVLISLYAALAAPKLSKTTAKIMDNVFVRVGVAFLIVYMASKDVTISLLISVSFVIALQTANKYKLYDTSLSVADVGSTSWLPSSKIKNVITDESVLGFDKPLPGDNMLTSVPDENLHGLSKDEVQAMRNAEPSNNLENFVEEIEGANVPSLVKTAFTTGKNLQDAQTDAVPGSKSNSCVTTFKNQHCIQGLQSNSPDGFNDPLPESNF